MDHAVGALLAGRYLLRREIARSSRAILFEARQQYLGRTVTVKLLRGDTRQDAEARGRLIREAKLLSQARHPAVVEVLDCGNAEELDPYLVTEMLDGRQLDGVLAARGRLELDDALSIVGAIGEALTSAHRRLLVHGALSPASVFLPTPLGGETRPDRAPAKLLDFGLSPNPTSIAEGALAAMGYAAPEVLAGEVAEPRSDVYSLGAVLYECLTGELPTVAADGQPRSAAELRPDLPKRLAAAVGQALSGPQERYQDMPAFVGALSHVHTEVPPVSLPPKQRRSCPRAPFVTPVRMLSSDAGTLDGRSEDISEGGLLVVAAGGAKSGQQLQVRFAQPTEGTVVSLTAEVRWCRAVRGGKQAVGLEFVDPPATVCADIARYVACWTGGDAAGRS